MSQDRTVLIVSLQFPPSTLAGVHRARHLAKHLPEFGWTPVVIRAGQQHYSESLDEDLAALCPGDLRQIDVGAAPAALSRLFGIGDIGIRCFAPLRTALLRAIAETRPSVVFITGAPFYPLLLSQMIKRRTATPVVLDFQDPWVSAYGATQPAMSKAGLSHRLACALEPIALRGASFVTSVSETQNREMADRYAWLDSTRMAAIPIGGDPDDFEVLRTTPPRRPQVTLDPQFINFSYVGAFLPRAEPLVRLLFRALESLRATEPSLAERLRLNFVGTSNQPDGFKKHCVRRIATEEGVDDLVHETPQRVPFLEALGLLANSHALLLIGSDEPHYTASKIYPALMSGTPYLSLFHRASSAHQILSAAGGGRALAFATADELAALQGPATQALRTLALAREEIGAACVDAYQDYTAQAVAGRFAAIFDQLADVR